MSNRVLILALGAVLGFPAAAQTTAAAPSLTLNLQEAIERAKKYSPTFQAALVGAGLAQEDRVQAKAALLPSVNFLNQYIFTQANGTPSGVYVANDGVHVYTSQGIVHGDVFSPAKRAEYQRTFAAEAAARAKADVAARGLVATVVTGYYGLVSSERKAANARRSLDEAKQFQDLTEKQERGGEAARADVVKARILAEQRVRDAQEADLSVERSRISLAVLLFPNYRQDFRVVDDFEAVPPLPELADVEKRATGNNPDLRAAQAAVRQETLGISAARGALLPSLSVDYFFGINANQFAIYNRFHQQNLGSAVQGTLSIPVWNWGALRSKVRQAQLRLEQAKVELGFAERQLPANLDTFYLEAKTAFSELDSLRTSVSLSAESLHLTLLRYQAGEATALEVSDAQSTVAQARNAYDDGLARYRLALAEIQTLTGVL